MAESSLNRGWIHLGLHMVCLLSVVILLCTTTSVCTPLPACSLWDNLPYIPAEVPTALILPDCPPGSVFPAPNIYPHSSHTATFFTVDQSSLQLTRVPQVPHTSSLLSLVSLLSNAADVHMPISLTTCSVWSVLNTPNIFPKHLEIV